MRGNITRFGLLFLIVLGLLFFSSANIVADQSSTRVVQPSSTRIESQYSPHDPIVITSNQNFIDQGWPGNGSKTNPYLIQELSIESDEECISISSTDVYFRISNCSFTYDTAQGGSTGVFLNAVHNGFVENCEFAGLFWSIDVDTIASVLFVNNSFYNEFYGMKLKDSVNCTLTNNEFQEVGLWIRGTERNHFLSNTLENNTVEGKPLSVLTNRSSETIDASSYGQLYLFNSSECIIENGIFDYRNVGVSLALCNDCTVRNLNSTYSVICLVELQLCFNTEVTSCDIADSFNAGFRFLYTVSCSLTGCKTGYSVDDSVCDGVGIYYNDNTTIARNVFHVKGIDGSDNTECLIVDNDVEGRSNIRCSGINLANSHNITLRGNELYELDIGLEFMWWSTNCTVFNNLIHDNHRYGIWLQETCERFRIYNNSFWYNDLANARDNGTLNYWDDGISIGNQWDDYNGTGVYNIPGSAGSVDHFPRADPYHTRTITTTTHTTEETTTDGSILPLVLGISGVGVAVVVVFIVLSKKR